MPDLPPGDRVSAPSVDYATLAANGAAAGLLYVDAVRGLQWMNAEAGVILGVTDINQLRQGPDNVLPTFVHEDGRPAEPGDAIGGQVLRTGLASAPTTLGRRVSSDTTVWFESSGRPVRDEAGQIMGVAVSCIDVSARVEATAGEQRALREIHSVFEAMNDGVVVQSSSGEIVSCNPAAERILGLTADQMAGRTSMDPRWQATHEDGTPFLGDTHPAMVALATGAPQRDVVMSVHKPDGTRTLISINAEPIGNPGERPSAVVATFVDISAYRETEHRLQALAEQVADLYNHAPCGYHSLGPDGTYQEINDTELAWLGVSRDELIGRLKPTDFFDDEGRATFGRNFPNPTGAGGQVEATLHGRHGDVRRVSVSATAIRDEAGRFLRSRSVMYDISDLARSRAAMEAHARDLEAMLNNDLVPIARLADRRITWLNPAAAQMFGYAQAELIGQSTRTLYADDASFDSCGREFYTRLAATGSVRLQWEMRRKDGSPLFVDLFGMPFRGGEEMLLFLSDVTMIRDTERRLQQTARMESLGRLAGGIAHELNNALQMIGGGAALLQQAATAGSFASETLQDMLTVVTRSALLVRQLTTYAGLHLTLPTPVHVNDLVSSTAAHVRDALPPTVRLLWHPDDANALVRVDATLFGDAVASLLANAIEAVASAGTINVRTGTATFAADVSDLNPQGRAGTFAFVSVSDDGPGMTETDRAHAFEPFYTTHRFGANRGLGLPSVFGMAQQAGGWVTLHSAPGAGTTATIYLPCVPAIAPAAPIAPAGGRVTVLLAEADPSVRGVAEQMLSRQGYHVIPCASGAEVLQRLTESPTRVGLLLTAALLPDVNVNALRAAVTGLVPALPILVMSSYPIDVLADRNIVFPGEPVLERPFTSQELQDALAAALARARER